MEKNEENKRANKAVNEKAKSTEKKASPINGKSNIIEKKVTAVKKSGTVDVAVAKKASKTAEKTLAKTVQETADKSAASKANAKVSSTKATVKVQAVKSSEKAAGTKNAEAKATTKAAGTKTAEAKASSKVASTKTSEAKAATTKRAANKISDSSKTVANTKTTIGNKADVKTASKTTNTSIKKNTAKVASKIASEKSGQIKSKKTSEAQAQKVAKKTQEVKEKAKAKEPEYDKDIDINFLEDEPDEKFDIDDLQKRMKERKKTSKNEKISIIKNSFYNLIFAAVFILFLVFCNYGFYNIEKGTMITNINLFSFLFLGVSIMLIETAYKEDKVTKCINGIEALGMGILALVLPYILQMYTDSFKKVISIAGISILVYYFIKSIIVFFINKRQMRIAKDDISKEKDDNEIEGDEEDDD